MMKKLTVLIGALFLIGCSKPAENKNPINIATNDNESSEVVSEKIDSEVTTVRDEPLPQGDVTYTGTKNVAEHKEEFLKLLVDLYDMKLQSKDELLDKLDKLKEYDVTVNVDDLVKLYNYTSDGDVKRIVTASSRVLSSELKDNNFNIQLRFAQSPTYGESVDSISKRLYSMLETNDELPIREVTYTYDESAKKLDLITKTWLFND